MPKKQINTASKYKKTALIVLSIINILGIIWLFVGSLFLSFDKSNSLILALPLLYSIYCIYTFRNKVGSTQLIAQGLIVGMVLWCALIFMSGFYLESIRSQCEVIAGYTNKCIEAKSYSATLLGYVLAVPASVLSIISFRSSKKINRK